MIPIASYWETWLTQWLCQSSTILVVFRRREGTENEYLADCAPECWRLVGGFESPIIQRCDCHFLVKCSGILEYRQWMTQWSVLLSSAYKHSFQIQNPHQFRNEFHTFLDGWWFRRCRWWYYVLAGYHRTWITECSDICSNRCLFPEIIYNAHTSRNKK